MTVGHRWEAELWRRAYLHEKPEMTGRLLWRSGEVLFRASHGALLDIQDGAVELSGEVGLVHPAELPAALLADWRRKLSSWQWERPLHRLDPLLKEELLWPVDRFVAYEELTRGLAETGWNFERGFLVRSFVELGLEVKLAVEGFVHQAAECRLNWVVLEPPRPWGCLPAAVFSEVMADLEVLGRTRTPES